MKSKIIKGFFSVILLFAVAAIFQSYKSPSSVLNIQTGTAYTEMFGHVTLVQGYEVAGYRGFHALVSLRDKPGGTVAILSTSDKLMGLCETALSTGNLMAFWGQKMATPPTPLGGSWSVDVYESNSILVYNMK